MPHYDYECQACGKTLEIFQSMSESPKKKCPECGKLKLKRLIGTGGGLIFKGSGFYITDYRSDSYKQAAKAEGAPSAGSSSESKSSTSAESKPSSGGGEVAVKPKESKSAS